MWKYVGNTSIYRNMWTISQYVDCMSVVNNRSVCRQYLGICESDYLHYKYEARVKYYYNVGVTVAQNWPTTSIVPPVLNHTQPSRMQSSFIHTIWQLYENYRCEQRENYKCTLQTLYCKVALEHFTYMRLICFQHQWKIITNYMWFPSACYWQIIYFQC